MLALNSVDAQDMLPLRKTPIQNHKTTTEQHADKLMGILFKIISHNKKPIAPKNLDIQSIYLSGSNYNFFLLMNPQKKY